MVKQIKTETNGTKHKRKGNISSEQKKSSKNDSRRILYFKKPMITSKRPDKDISLSRGLRI